jgi:hypothetical protein
MQFCRRRNVAMTSRLFGIVVAATALVACMTTRPQVSAEHARGAIVAFESIDGAPRPAADRLLGNLTEEAKARQLVVAPRGGHVNYHIRGYLSADGGAIAWAWDVYDAGRRRAFRLTGEERASGSWNDDAALRRIARASVEQLTAFIAADRAPGTAAASSEVPAPTRVMVALQAGKRP